MMMKMMMNHNDDGDDDEDDGDNLLIMALLGYIAIALERRCLLASFSFKMIVTITTMLMIDHGECYTFGNTVILLHSRCLLAFVGFLTIMLISSDYDRFAVHNSPCACLHV